MRSKIKFEGKFYRPVPWIVEGECKGCRFVDGATACPNHYDSVCDDGNEFAGKVLIATNKEALANYVAAKLGLTDEPQTTPEQTNL